jgi:hypothetical protein
MSSVPVEVEAISKISLAMSRTGSISLIDRDTAGQF